MLSSHLKAFELYFFMFCLITLQILTQTSDLNVVTARDYCKILDKQNCLCVSCITFFSNKYILDTSNNKAGLVSLNVSYIQNLVKPYLLS